MGDPSLQVAKASFVFLSHHVCFWKLILFFSSTKQITERDQELNICLCERLHIVKILFKFNYCKYLHGIEDKKCS